MNKKAYDIFFTNMANPLKIKIVLCLMEKTASVNEISGKLKVEQSKISHALKNLKNCNIVNVMQKGRQRIYSLNRSTIVPILKLIDRHAREYCECRECRSSVCGRER